MTKNGKIISLSLFATGILMISLSISVLPWWTGKTSSTRNDYTVTHHNSEKLLFSSMDRSCKGNCRRITSKVQHRSHFEKLHRMGKQIKYHSRKTSKASTDFIIKLNQEKKRAELKAYYGLVAALFHIFTMAFIIVLVTMKLRGTPLHGKLVHFAIPLTSIIISSAASGLFIAFSHSDVLNTPSFGIFAAGIGILCLIALLFSPLFKK